MSKEWSPDDVFDVLASQTARNILLLASIEPLSAQQLATACDVSKPTIYRRVTQLQEYDLLEQHLAIQTDGTHYHTYSTNADRICFSIEDEEFVVTIHADQDLVDRFISRWQRLGNHDNDDDD
ncbi:MAG: helix-turn-helix domain-containing protein [Halorientalis sp.]